MLIVEETVVSSGEILRIESGEVLDNVIVNSGGKLIVASDGTANSTTLNSSGYLHVSSDGTADNTSIENGFLFVSSGGTANLTTVTSGKLNALGGTVNDTTVNSYGTLNVESGTVSNTVLNEKGAMLRIDSDGIVYNTTVSSGCTIDFISGMVSNTIISSGGTLSFNTFPTEGNRVVDTLVVKDGGIVKVTAGGKLTGQMTFESGASITMLNYSFLDFDLTRTTVGAEALVNDLSLVKLKPTYTLTVDGTQESGVYLLAANASSFTGTLTVQNTLGESLGTLTVGTPATISDVDYTLSLSTDGVLSLQIAKVTSGLVLENEERTVSAGELYQDTTVNVGGSLFVESDGTADSTTINSGGSMFISGGGTATEIVENGGYVQVANGADVSFAPNTFRELIFSTGNATVHSGTTADKITVRDGSSMTVFSGGTAYNTEATSRGSLNISSGGVANNVFVRSSGIIDLSSGGKLTGKLICLDGVVSARSGAIVDFDLTHKSPGATALYFFDSDRCMIQGAPTYTITVNSDQAEGLYSLSNYANGFDKQITVQNTEGTALGVLSVGETITISDTAYTLSVSDNTLSLKIGENNSPSPYTSDGVVVYTGQKATVSSGEVYHDTEIWGGQMVVLSGGTADVAAIHAFNGYGSVFVSSGGSVNDVTVNSICYLTVSDGATAKNTTVKPCLVGPYGGLFVQRGGKLTGQTVISSGAIVSVGEGAVLDFDISELAPGAAARFNDLSLIGGGGANLIYTLTVDGTQASGNYILAEGASSFTGTIRVQDTLGKKIGTLTVGTPATISGTYYALSLSDDGALSLQIAVVSSGIVLENNARTVKSDQIYLDTTVNSGGSLTVADGGIAAGVKVNSGGSLRVSAGATATNIMENGGNVVVRDGATVAFHANTFRAVTLKDKTTATVHSGTTAASTTVNAGLLAVYSGGIANGTTVNSGGTLFISSGGAGENTRINSGGRMAISSGGSASGAIVNSGGTLSISGGGAASSAIINSGGTLSLSSGGMAEDTRVSIGGRMIIASGGTAEKTNATSSGMVTVLNGGVASDVYVRADGKILISSGGKLTGKVIDLDGVISAAYGAIVDFDLTHKMPGAAQLVFWRAGTGMFYSGNPTFTITVNPDQAEGIYSLFDCGQGLGDSQITVQDTEGTTLGVFSSIGETFIVSGTAYKLCLFGNTLALKIGENITPSPYTSDGVVVYISSATVSSGEIYHDTEIWGGQMYVLSGGTADIVSVNPFSRGSVFISSGGTANSVMVNSYCSMFVSGGGTVNRAEIKTAGELHISSGGTATEILENGGYVSVADDADVTFVPNTIKGLLLENANATVHSVTTATDITISTSGSLYISSGGTANGTTVNSGWLHISSGGKANSTAIIKGTREVGGAMFVSSGGVADDTTIQGGGWLDVSSGGVANNTMVNASMFVYTGGTANGVTVSGSGFLHVGFSSGNWFESGGMVHNVVVSGGSMNVAYGGKANITTVDRNGRLSVVSGGEANSATVNGSASMFVSKNGTANGTTLNSGGTLSISSGGVANGITVNSGGSIAALQSGTLTGRMVFESDAAVSMAKGAILDFDLTQAEAGGAALVSDLSIIKGLPTYTLTVDGTQANGVYTLAEGAADFTGTISVQSTPGKSLGMLKVGETLSIDGTDYLLTNDNDALSVMVKGGDTPANTKWTYLVYMAADSNLSMYALYDIISMQQAELDPMIDIYVLVDRAPAEADCSGDLETVNGTYQWGSFWSDTRVGKITRSPGMTVTVDWESWGELDTGSIATLERFVDWAQAESPADKYGLVLWDHGGENAELCWDLTTDPNWGANLTVSEVSGLLKEKGNIPIVVFNTCLLGSEITVTQMAGSTEVIVVSEPTSYAMATYNYNAFFNTITADMTPQEMAAVMVLNVEPMTDNPAAGTMLSAIDVTDTRLGDALEALAEAVAAADNAADKAVLIRALLKAPQEGCVYDGSEYQQSDLGFLIRDVLADSSYESTSEEFKKALADVKTALESVVLEFRSVPAKRGSGIAICNTVYSAVEFLPKTSSVKKVDTTIKSYITSTYKSNPLWGGLLYDLSSTYLKEAAVELLPPATFSISYVDGVVDGKSIAVSDIGCFSGLGECFESINLMDEVFFGFVITADDTDDKSTGGFIVRSDSEVPVRVSVLTSDGKVVAKGDNSVSFENLDVGNYYLRLQSETNGYLKILSDANFMTGVDRFDYAGSGRNEKYVNGNGSTETATSLDEGYYTGLITYKGDTDYYRIGNIYTEQYSVELYGEEGWTVAECDAGTGIYKYAEFSDGKYTLTMGSMNYLIVEGTTDLEEGLSPYSFSVVGIKNGATDVVELDELAGTKDEVSWKSSTIVDQYLVECSMDNFEHVIHFVTTGTAVDLLNLPAGTYQWRVKADTEDETEWFVGNEIVSDNTDAGPKVFLSKADASDDLFFASPNGTWSSSYCARHHGTVGDWTGTNELVSADGKSRIQDLFFGSADPGTLYLTDSENGDALFLDDVYTGLPEEIEENMARLFRIRYIIAGAGDDIIDMTSQRFEYSGGNLMVCGGDGDDVIWANKGRNMLFGDDGNDSIVGASSDDVITGGIGNDTMHGGGGDDIFTFCENWGVDTVKQLSSGSVTLWFASGDIANWNEETLTYSDGVNSVAVSGVTAEQITLKFGEEETSVFSELDDSGAFDEFSTMRVFDKLYEPQTGILA
jgi:autotransporter passenger strand-loop-strand repeat protein